MTDSDSNGVAGPIRDYNDDDRSNTTNMDLIFQTRGIFQSKTATGCTIDSDSLNSSGCPPGLEYLFVADSLYLNPYSGPHVIGHISKKKSYEIINGEGERIFMLKTDFLSKSMMVLMKKEEDDLITKHPVHLSVVNHMDQEVFQYYGTHGKMIRVGSKGSLPWGEVKRYWEASKFCRIPNLHKLCFEVIIHNNHKFKKKSNEADGYSIEGRRNYSCFPSSETRKLYYGKFDCEIIPYFKNADATDEIVIGQISSNLFCRKLGIELPGIIFPKRSLSVYHKAVLFSSLLVNIIRN